MNLVNSKLQDLEPGQTTISATALNGKKVYATRSNSGLTVTFKREGELHTFRTKQWGQI